ncbi:MAG: hypothetical protein DYG96_13330 [Chlorobi bacterium CHB2]|nr:hypothetical protein [Chlorobi bacterium CHB2]
MKHTYKWSASALLFTFSIWIFSGCGGHPPIAPGIPGDIAFNLLIPSNTPKGDYQAISGLSVAQTSTKVGDTTLTSISRSFYGQFTGTPLPGNVLLNNVPLARYRTSDTLRLNNGDATIFGPNTWAFVDTLTGDTARFPAIMVDPIDTVGPFTTDNFIRADTTLRLAWRPPTNGSGGVLITWVAPPGGVPVCGDAALVAWPAQKQKERKPGNTGLPLFFCLLMGVAILRRPPGCSLSRKGIPLFARLRSAG